MIKYNKRLQAIADKKIFANIARIATVRITESSEFLIDPEFKDSLEDEYLHNLQSKFEKGFELSERLAKQGKTLFAICDLDDEENVVYIAAKTAGELALKLVCLPDRI